jgi:hypothetical protein
MVLPALSIALRAVVREVGGEDGVVAQITRHHPAVEIVVEDAHAGLALRTQRGAVPGAPIRIKLRQNERKLLWHHDVVTHHDCPQELPYGDYTTGGNGDAGRLDHGR